MMRFVEGTRLHFTQETAQLLRTRLGAAAAVLSVVLACALGFSFLEPNTPLVALRGLILVMVAGSWAVLQLRYPFSLVQLRGFELCVFGAVVLQVALMMYARIAAEGAAGQPWPPWLPSMATWAPGACCC
jgi:CDP-diglyceride synthetase